MPDPQAPDLDAPRVDRSARWIAFRLAALGVALTASAGLFEISTRILVSTGVLTTPRPPSADEFWSATAEPWGVWPRPNVALRHETDCFRAEYETNSVGARDVERATDAAGPRVVVLGDSFVEGWGVERDDRFSDRLEAATGIEHLNFGMAHFSPYQEYLVYRELASGFEHDAVLIGLLPHNDFFDLDYRLAREAPAYEYRYRRYLVGPDFEEVDYREPRVPGWLRRRSYGFNALAFAWQRLAGRDVLEREAPRLPSGLVHSYFYDFEEEQFALLRRVLELLDAAAEGKRLAVVLIPVHRDLVRYHQSGDSPLARRLRDLGTRLGFQVVDLSPALHDFTPDWDQYYYLPCDYHWNALGNRVAAETLRRELAGELYPR